MALVPYRRRRNVPSSIFDEFHNMLDDFFDENWSTSSSSSTRRDNFKVNVKENDNEYMVTAELPGVEKDQINLDYNDGRLLIQVKREDQIDEEKENYIHKESYFSSMSRSVYLPDSKKEGIKAKLDNGVLSVTLPRDEKDSKTKTIEIE